MLHTLRVAFIGAGGINFGGAEGPWGHALRLETISNEGHNYPELKNVRLAIEVVAIADVDTERASKVLEERREKGSAPQIWANTKIYGAYSDLLTEAKPDCIFVGLPPLFHGQTREGRDIELQCQKLGIHCFVEKPISLLPPEEMRELAKGLATASEDGLVVSVGYMFRYCRAVECLKQELAKHFKEEPGTSSSSRICAVLARYCCAYSQINKKEWWDQRSAGGPIVEQATHFCDLARYLAGEVDLKSLRAVGIGPQESLGALSALPIDRKSVV